MDEFIKKMESLFPNTPVEEISADAEYKYFDDWSSMASLQLIAMVEDDYGIIISSEEIRNADTIEELYYLITK
ncbi:MAG: acyl carrier protein [Prevotella sp.]